MGRGSGKDGRPTVSDLIQAREAEAASRDAEVALRKELAEERKRHEAFRWEESCRTSRIIAEKELEYLQQVQQIRGLPSSEHDSNPPPGLLDKPEPVMSPYGRQKARIRRRHPNNARLHQTKTDPQKG